MAVRLSCCSDRVRNRGVGRRARKALEAHPRRQKLTRSGRRQALVLLPPAVRLPGSHNLSRFQSRIKRPSNAQPGDDRNVGSLAPHRRPSLGVDLVGCPAYSRSGVTRYSPAAAAEGDTHLKLPLPISERFRGAGVSKRSLG
jgi:hypothetical protein